MNPPSNGEKQLVVLCSPYKATAPHIYLKQVKLCRKTNSKAVKM
jgi:hypothetical protein